MNDTQDSVPKMRKGITRRKEGVATILLSHLFQNCLFMYPVFKDTCQHLSVSTFSSGAFDFTRLPRILKDKKRTSKLIENFQALFNTIPASYPTYFELHGYPTSKIQPIQTNDIVCQFEAGILRRDLKIRGLKCQQCQSIAFESEGREYSKDRKYLPRVGLEWKECLRNR